MFEQDWLLFLSKLKPRNFHVHLAPHKKPNAPEEMSSSKTFVSKVLPVIFLNDKCLANGADDLALFAKQEYDFSYRPSLVTCSRAAKKSFKHFLSIEHSRRNFVFLDFSISSSSNDAKATESASTSINVTDGNVTTTKSRVVFQLFSDIVPVTCKNFELFCEEQVYKDTVVHKILPGKYIQTGDYKTGKGDFSACFNNYKQGDDEQHKFFFDESFSVKHDQPGLLSMANEGKRNTNGSQFFITVTELPELDRKHVVFGRVVSGYRIIKLISKLETTEQFRPVSNLEVKITDCGFFHRNV